MPPVTLLFLLPLSGGFKYLFPFSRPDTIQVSCLLAGEKWVRAFKQAKHMLDT